MIQCKPIQLESREKAKAMSDKLARVEVIRDRKIVSIEIPLGEIDHKDVIYAYGNGQCAALALAIHELMKWPMVALFSAESAGRPEEWDEQWHGKTVKAWREKQPKGWSWGWRHTLVQTPDKRFYDIQGIHSFEIHKKAYGSCAMLIVTKKDVLDMESDRGVRQPFLNVELAKEYAPLFLKRAGFRIK
ncbi:hypothetical protein [Shimazuella alba]|uniref:Uncharacterized protein n=1 Tax=Shimazuella alba TaxID=2690964 RepID=A0A6I4VQX8_9BACL|nr:hypothetical protein [Shimazuella alba]MXQ52798.1 hypothetical protein [Shimazuella alba]